MVELSLAQHRALELAARFGDDFLERWRGGYWTFAGCQPAFTDYRGERVPETYTATITVFALLKRGLFEPAGRNDWGDIVRVRITFAALDLLKQLGPTQ